jgi:hypothetical protein
MQVVDDSQAPLLRVNGLKIFVEWNDGHQIQDADK